ncbi:MAG TPA: hypothetical protein VHH35_12485 [Pyrinomonadaceae bacterium]|nr:hypothetical protein [Pyrinomonadaceae bacterium]
MKVQRGETTPITAAEAEELLPGGTNALLEFVVAEDKSYLVLLTRDSTGPLQITLYQLNVTAKQLSEEVGEFRRSGGAFRMSDGAWMGWRG